MKNWIELHDAFTNGEILVNTNTIEGVYIEGVAVDAFVTAIDVIDGGKYSVKETYEEVKEMICHVN